MYTTGWSQYKRQSSSSWTGSQTPSNQYRLTSVRLTPVKSNYANPTAWGAFAERMSIPAFDYKTKGSSPLDSYDWRGEGDNTTMKLPSITGKGIGTVSTSGIAVVVGLPLTMSTASRTRALEGLSQRNIDVGVLLGELPETISTLANLSVRVFRSLRHARKGRWRRALQALNGGSLRSVKNSANNYLQYSYGLRPILSDAYGLQQQIKDGFASKGDRIRSVGFISTSTTANALTGSSGGSQRDSGTARCFSRTVIYSSISGPQLYALNQLGLTNPVAVAWELVPLSFVIDWFLPIGSFLNALTAPLGTTFSRGFEDRVIEVNTRGEYCRYGFGGYESGRIQSYHYQLFAFQRLTLGSLPTPGLYLGSGITSSAQRAVAGAALLRQRS